MRECVSKTSALHGQAPRLVIAHLFLYPFPDCGCDNEHRRSQLSVRLLWKGWLPQCWRAQIIRDSAEGKTSQPIQIEAILLELYSARILSQFIMEYFIGYVVESSFFLWFLFVRCIFIIKYRLSIWNVPYTLILKFNQRSFYTPFVDVAPMHTDCQSFVMNQRQEVYDDLNRALHVMNIINDQTPTSNAFYAMWLLENKQLHLGLNINVSIWRTIWFLFFFCAESTNTFNIIWYVFCCVSYRRIAVILL